MSIYGRATDDYSPLRNPSPERDRAINARREMLGIFESRPQPRLTKKERERFQAIPPHVPLLKGETREARAIREKVYRSNAMRVLREW